MDVRPGGRQELRRQLEENPEWESDLLALFGFDIWDAIDGRVPIRRAYTLLDRLRHEPNSVWRAKQLAGPELKDFSEFLGWDAKVYALADLIDAVNQNTSMLVAVNSESHEVPEVTPYPRPGRQAESEETKENLEDFGSKLLTLFSPGHF